MRRKKKKRCNNKKHRAKNSPSQSSDTSTTSEAPDPSQLAAPAAASTPGLPSALAADQGVFVMDDIEVICQEFQRINEPHEEKVPLSMCR